MKLEQYISTIPYMSDDTVKNELRLRASQVKKELCIVEVGAWLGSSTGYLALGTKDSGNSNMIHVFDRFKANENEVFKAKLFETILSSGQDTQQVFKNFMKPFNNIISYKGNILNIEWNGGEIGLYVDDASKRKVDFDHSMNIFGKYFIKGTVLMLLDFYFYEVKFNKNAENWEKYRCQEEYMEANKDKFEFLGRIDKSTAAIFIKK